MARKKVCKLTADIKVTLRKWVSSGVKAGSQPTAGEILSLGWSGSAGALDWAGIRYERVALVSDVGPTYAVVAWSPETGILDILADAS